MRIPLVALVLGLAGGAGAEPARPAYLPAPSGPARASGPGFELKREPGRGWVYQHAGFTARVEEDGTVTFRDRHGDVNLVWPLPLPLPEGTPTLEGSVRKLFDPRARRPRPPAGDPPTPVEQMSPFRPSPSEWCRYPHPCAWQARIMFINARGTFDINDEILRLQRKDPYRNQKAAFLGSTLAFRQEVGKRFSDKARARALEELRRRLDAIDRDPKLDPAGRRAAIQALADDLDPNPDVAGPARQLIEGRLSPAR